MALALELNKKTNITISPTLAGAPGQLDAASPFSVVLEPAENGTVENAVLAAGGQFASVDVTMTVLGDTVIRLAEADGNLAGGVININASDTITTVEQVVVGADGATFAVTPPAV